MLSKIRQKFDLYLYKSWHPIHIFPLKKLKFFHVRCLSFIFSENIVICHLLLSNLRLVTGAKIFPLASFFPVLTALQCAVGFCLMTIYHIYAFTLSRYEYSNFLKRFCKYDISRIFVFVVGWLAKSDLTMWRLLL